MTMMMITDIIILLLLSLSLPSSSVSPTSLQLSHLRHRMVPPSGPNSSRDALPCPAYDLAHFCLPLEVPFVTTGCLPQPIGHP
eukprot:scaffold567042_cov10-Prasinocladus_malaysianus.AAC.1